MKKFVVVSKQIYPEQGRLVLMSFARTPIIKTFESVYRQNDSIPNCYTREDCEYAKKKYFADGIIIPYEQALLEFNQYVSSK
jgi:hypothetical protein